MATLKTYIRYFERETEVLRTLRLPADSRHAAIDLALHRKILALAMFESLAAIRFGKGGNRLRFLSLLQEHGGWPEAQWVSAPVLLERIKDLGRTPLLADLRQRVKRYSTDRGNSLPLSAFDAPVQDFVALAETEEEKHWVRKSTHAELLWAFRNFVVHEYREPGYAMELGDEHETAPCYHGVLRSPDWRLLYPVGFFLDLLSKALASLEKYYRVNRINPYSRVYSSALWHQA